MGLVQPAGSPDPSLGAERSNPEAGSTAAILDRHGAGAPRDDGVARQNYRQGVLARALRNVSNRRGTAALEYALLAPALFMLTVGILDVGRLMWEYNSLLHGAAAAARCGAVDQNNCMTGAQIKAYAAAQTWGSLVTAPYYGVTFTSCGVLVQARTQIWLYTPGLPNFVLTPSVCVPTLFNAYNRQ